MPLSSCEWSGVEGQHGTTAVAKLLCCSQHNRCLLLKLDTQTCSILVMEVCITDVVCVCIQRGMCTAPHPSNMAPHPLQVLCLIRCKIRPVDGATDLFV